ncbi:MAG: CBS domain-containing protein [Planctomycetota bacterium]|jgi:CBS domain-containing protein
MLVDKLMSKEVFSCHADDDMGVAAKVLWEHDCGCVPVVEDDLRVIGMITDRDMCMAACTQGQPLKDMTVASTMSRQVQTCKAADSVSDALDTMKMHKVRRLPVVDQSNHLVGLLSIDDIARDAVRETGSSVHGVSREAVADALAAICRPRVIDTSRS